MELDDYNPETLIYINPRYMTDDNVIYYLTLALWHYTKDL